jgi:flagellin
MTSILTNTAAMSALSSLTNTQSQLSKTQAQISSGLAVANASDNAAYWSIGQTMRAQVAGLNAMQTSLGLTASIANVTATALSAILSGVQKIKNDVISAQTSGVDKSKVQNDISGQIQSIRSIAYAASFNGVSWLSFDNSITNPDSTDISERAGTSYGGFDGNSHLTASPYYDSTSSYGPYVGAFSSTFIGEPKKIVQVPVSIGAQGVQFSSIDISSLQMLAPASSTSWWIPGHETDQGILDGTMALSHQSISSLDITHLDSVDLKNVADDLGFATNAITGAAAKVATIQTQMTTMQSFNSSLSDALTSGVGSLVDADMNIASTRLQALQTQQQLGIQALSMANQNSQIILKLFQAA